MQTLAVDVGSRAAVSGCNGAFCTNHFAWLRDGSVLCDVFAKNPWFRLFFAKPPERVRQSDCVCCAIALSTGLHDCHFSEEVTLHDKYQAKVCRRCLAVLRIIDRPGAPAQTPVLSAFARLLQRARRWACAVKNPRFWSWRHWRCQWSKPGAAGVWCARSSGVAAAHGSDPLGCAVCRRPCRRLPRQLDPRPRGPRCGYCP